MQPRLIAEVEEDVGDADGQSSRQAVREGPEAFLDVLLVEARIGIAGMLLPDVGDLRTDKERHLIGGGI